MILNLKLYNLNKYDQHKDIGTYGFRIRIPIPFIGLLSCQFSCLLNLPIGTKKEANVNVGSETI